MKLLAELFTGVVSAPRATFSRLFAGEGNPLLPILAYVVVQLAIVGQALYKSAHLFSEAPESVSRRLFVDAIWRRGSSHADVAILLVVAATLAVVARWFAPVRAHPRATINAVIHLLVPVTLGMALGFILRVVEVELWFMPHTAIDSQAILVRDDGRVVVSWMRFAIKCAVAYGPAFVLLVVAARDLWLAPDRNVEDALPPPSTNGANARKLIGAVLVWGLIGASVLGSVINVANEAARSRPLLPGDRVPATSLPWLTSEPGLGKKFDASAYRGKILVIDFWASWCAPCRKAIPDLNAIAQKSPGRVMVVGVNREPRNVRAATTAYRDLKFAFPSALDRRAGSRRGFGERIGIQSLPTTILVDADGIVHKIHLGYTSAEVLNAEIAALLAAEDRPQ